MSATGLQPFADLNCWPAPAKINLFLHIVGKRADGYHELQTIFQLLDVADELSFAINSHGEITRSYELGFSVESDLCLRAAQALQQRLATGQGVTISINKKLPLGGGLGGGSSDAATVLIALNHLWQGGLTISELAQLGLSLGADVPVFVRGRSAWAEGIGEQLTPLDLPAQKWLVLTPQVQVSTAQIFSHKQLTARAQMMKIRAFQQAPKLDIGENQLEPLVRAQFPQVEALFDWLDGFSRQQSFGPHMSRPRMSGSGGSVFVAINDQQCGEHLLANKPADCTGFIANGLNFHPLYSA